MSRTYDNSGHMPAEWEPHRACLMTYPHNRQVWRSNCEPAGDQYRAVARAIAQFEDVLLFCNTQELADKVRKVLDKEGGAERIYCHVAPSDDSWARDPGPTFVLDSFKRLVGIDWDFNAYGGEKEGCYWPCDKDKALCTKMCEAVAAQYGIYVGRHKVPLVLEGGSIHTDGEGTVLTTEECLLNPNRNPQLTKKEIEDHVLKALGCTKMIWLPHGVANDEDTNGHVDNWCMFARPGEVILSWCDDDSDENYKRCRESMAVLEKETDAKGRKLKVHKLPPPPPMYYTQKDVDTLATASTDTGARKVGDRLAASYVNCYVGNNCVIVPQLGHEKSDANAIKILEKIFPERKIVGVHSREILLGGGNIHCITQQVPMTKV